jgi:hypothetical protein
LPEINDKNLVESTRGEIHDQVAAIAKTLAGHIIENKFQFAETKELAKVNHGNIEKLTPLAALAPTIEDMVERQKALTYMSSIVLKLVTFIGIVVGIIYTIYRIVKDIR